jgi:hypothetical protein
MGASRRWTLPAAAVLPAILFGCGHPDGGPPDRGDVPEGHVRFELTFRRGPLPTSPDQPGGPQRLYLQEYDLAWSFGAGPVINRTLPGWVGFHVPTEGSPVPIEEVCRCDQCGACRNPSIDDGTLRSSPQVGELRDGATARYEWDGTIWTRTTCPDGSDCVLSEPAPPGRYAIEFTWGLNYSHHVDWLYAHVEPPYGSSGPIYFDYPAAGVVSYTVDCSRSSNVAEPVEPCI